MKFSRMIAAALACSAPFSFSAGFMLNEQSVSTLARGLAGRGVVGDNAADIAHNPATSALFSGQSMTVLAHYVDPNINVKGEHSVMVAPETYMPIGEGKVSNNDIAPSEIVPNFYYVLPINDQFSFGLSLNSHFGMSTEYSSDFGAPEMANKTGIKTVYVTPSFAWKVNDQFSLGLGLSYIYGSGEIKNNMPDLGQLPSPIPAGQTLLDIDGDGSAFGWSIGGLWNITDSQRIGLSYRSAVDLDADADVTHVQLTQGKKGSGSITFNLPDTVDLAYFNQLNETWAIAAGAQWIKWSRFKDLTVDIDGFGEYTFKEENWEDSYRLSIGGDYRLNKLVNFHAGYAFDKSPVKSEYRTLTIPDADRNWFTFGATLDFETAGEIDLAFAYIKGDKVKVNEKSAIGTNFDGELSKVDALVMSIGYNYNF
ncbi:MAG: outer membrane protein transport protein [Cellvibrionales bacterium]|nr:outer membrane protein transport protein [Cellvibrionales bacterium]